MSNSEGWGNTAEIEQQLINRDPEIMSGTPVFRGTRVPIKNLFDYLRGGSTIHEFLDDFPSVAEGQAIAVLELVKHLILTPEEMDKP
ncbi:MAG: DUF433 domain-containing protein [Chloroflexota bacterium]|nr:DUF433 domain-containing protein [Chloroflexota bacterium]